MTERIKEIKRNLRLKRKSLTQVVIANRLGISQQHLNMILHGKRTVPKHLENRFNKIFNNI